MSRITERRALKREFAELCLRCAKLGPIALSGNGILTEEESDAVAREGNLFVFERATDAAGINTLRTAKGCNRPPAGLENPSFLTLYDFLKGVLAKGGDCAAGYTHDLALWGKQVVSLNPNSFNAQQRTAFLEELKSREDEAIASNERYGENPGLYGDPRSADQAFDWMLFHLAYILADRELLTAATVGDVPIPLDQRAAVQTEWRAKFDALSPEFRRNPNVEALHGALPRAAKLAIKYKVKVVI